MTIQCSSLNLQSRAKLLLKVEEQIAAELQSLGLLATREQPEPQLPEYTDLAKLTYLACVIKESMRMHTVSPLEQSVNECMQCRDLSSVAKVHTCIVSSCPKAPCTQVCVHTDNMHFASTVQHWDMGPTGVAHAVMYHTGVLGGAAGFCAWLQTCGVLALAATHHSVKREYLHLV